MEANGPLISPRHRCDLESLTRPSFVLQPPDYFYNADTASGFTNGFGALSVGFKQQLGPTRGGFDVSLIPFVSFPTGANLISSHGYDPTVQLPWSRSLTKNWTVAGMFSLMWPTEGGRRNLMGQSSLYFDRQFRQPWDAYIEYSGTFPQRGGPQNVIDFGTAYKPSPHQQLDFHWASAFRPQRRITRSASATLSASRRFDPGDRSRHGGLLFFFLRTGLTHYT